MTEGDNQSQKADEEGSQVAVDLISISNEAVNGSENNRTFRLQCTIQDQEVLMLLDSGSSHCFVSADFAQRLKGVQRAIRPVQVRVANGGLLECVKELP